ncbi:sugar (pentulose or hexulose) kinase [Pseudomonas psychrotolerans]|uniref:Sugar (Pentulose or hexulose) kinase n=1 Tax=Pseudomonas oryzihabitans TaxID=47885 RepID=A0AAJ2EUX3_9PSED|nr:sugar (pentulose or hexulose) kinase [Pseudomonas psychrotolerans]
MRFLGIDCGTQGTKVVVLDAQRGSVLGEGSAPHRLTEGANGRREQEPADWIAALVSATRTALAQAGSDGQDILGIGVSGQQHGLVLLDESGQVLRPAKLWCDTESTPENQRLLDYLGGVEGSLARLGLAIAPGYTVSKLLWTKEQHPEVFARIAHVLLPHDYLNFWLTGRAVAEYGDASGTGYFDVRNRRYDLELLRHIDPSGRLERALPELIEADQPVGRLRPEIAAQLGINPQALVSSGGGDNMMGALGTGNSRAGQITLSLGTSGTLYGYSDEPRISEHPGGGGLLLVQWRLAAADLHHEPDQRQRPDPRAARPGPG